MVRLVFFVLWNEMASSVELWSPSLRVHQRSVITDYSNIYRFIDYVALVAPSSSLLSLSLVVLPPSSQHPIFSSLSHTQQHAGATAPCRRHRVRQRYTLTSAVFPRAPPLHLSLTRYAHTFKFKTSKSIFDNSQSRLSELPYNRRCHQLLSSS